MLWASGDIGSSSSLALTHRTHTLHLTGSGRLHSTAPAVFGGCSIALGSPECWGVHCFWGRSLTIDFSWSLFRSSDPATWRRASISLPDPVDPGASVTTEAATSPGASPGFSQCHLSCSPWPLPIFKTSYYLGILVHHHAQLPSRGMALVSSGPQLLCGKPEEMLLDRWSSMRLPSF